MALLFCDSFDHYTEGDIALKWTTSSGELAISTSYGRNSTNGLRLRTDAASDAYVRKVFSSTFTTLIAGCSFNPSGSGTGARPVLAFDDQSVPGEQIGVGVNYDTNQLFVTRNGTILATGTTVLTAGVSYYIEFQATISATGAYELRINGTTELSDASVDTRGSGTSTVNAVRLGGTLGVSVYGGGSFQNIGNVDDLYICDDSGSTNNDFLGDIRVCCLFPDGPGTTTGLTPSTGVNWQNVDETDIDDDTTYNSGGVGDLDTYTMTDLPVTTGTIYGIQSVVTGRKDDSGSRTMAPVWHLSATDYVGTARALSTDYSMGLQVYETSPDTSVAWTISEVNGAEHGEKVVA